MTLTTDQIQGLTGKVYSHSGDKIGSIGQIYVDDTTGAPSWVTVKMTREARSIFLRPMRSDREQMVMAPTSMPTTPQPTVASANRRTIRSLYCSCRPVRARALGTGVAANTADIALSPKDMQSLWASAAAGR